MKLPLFIIVTTALVASGGPAAGREKDAAPDPIIGQWHFPNGDRIVIQPDGVALANGRPRGVWRFLKNPEVERKYEIVWDDGVFIDVLRLSRDGKKLEGKNQQGKRIIAIRLKAPKD